MRFGIKAVVMLFLASLAMGLVVSTASGAPPLQRQAIMWHAQTGKSGPVGEKAFATLLRTSEGVSFQVMAHNLIPGHAYTLWFVAVNNPAACNTRPCAAPEIINNPATNSQVTGVGGGIAGSGGELGLGGVVPVGVIADGWLAGRGLENPLGAEIHLVINDHGPAIPGREATMTSTYRDGCTDASLPGVFPASAKADGQPGPNSCQLYEVVIFQ